MYGVKRVIEEMLIEHCAPTLANLKMASLFRYFLNEGEDIEEYLNRWNMKMKEKGIVLTCLKKCENTALIYVYRIKKLEQEIDKLEIQNFLKSYGYKEFTVKECLVYLKEQFQRECSFPHEIGIFLGYPLEDICGFIENEGKNYKCTGCWKVYGDAKEAKKIFGKFDKCRGIYRKQFMEGKSIMRLTVAA